MQDSSLSSHSLWLLTAMQLRGVGPVAVRKLFQELAAVSFSDRGKIVDEQKSRLLLSSASEKDALLKAEDILLKCSMHDIGVISLLDNEYPPMLRATKNSPPILYYKGSLPALARKGCAVVGTRKASDVGSKIAYKIASQLSGCGFSVVSGLALGIDSAAHRGALSVSGATIAVMAHGLDTVHPSSNKHLAQLILAENGALLSEHQPGVPPRPAEFVRRNRIQSGMSICSIIVESGSTGGAIHQANFTVGQGRPLYVITPDMSNTKINDFNLQGALSLIESVGAVPLKSSEEVIEAVLRASGSSTVADNLFIQTPLF